MKNLRDTIEIIKTTRESISEVTTELNEITTSLEEFSFRMGVEYVTELLDGLKTSLKKTGPDLRGAEALLEEVVLNQESQEQDIKNGVRKLVDEIIWILHTTNQSEATNYSNLSPDARKDIDTFLTNWFKFGYYEK